MLMIPILGTQLAQTGMGVVDTLVAGMAGTLDLASIAVGSSIWLPLVLFESGIMLALSPLVAQAKGAKDKAQSARHLQQGIYLGLVIGLIAMLILLFGTAPVMNIMEISQEIQLITKEYLLYIALSLPAVAVHQAFRSYNEAVHLTSPVTIIAFAGLVLNVPLNLLFVFGFGPIDAMGGAGCGLASLIVFYMMAIAIWLYTYFSRFHQKVKPLHTFKKPNLAHMQHILKIGLPIGLAIFAEVSLFCIIALFIARLGPDIVAAHQITLNISTVLFMIPLSLGMALTVLVGNELGKQNQTGAKLAWKNALYVNLFLATFNAAFIYFLGERAVTLYSQDDHVIEIATYLLLHAAVFQISDSIQITAAGALRGYNDTLATFVLSLIAFWGVGLPLGYYLGLAQDAPMGAAGFWVGLIIGLSVNAVFLLARLRVVSRKVILASNTAT
ncbi:MATE family efflux transporter [Oceaniserpentilla sp. 4NH20-0058]|uniref:MATE family efflux transporter n=1 Tax=Oceaniserpentilla sp. 4NH20-0058 TaxID=3127660 RepID=UPI00333F7ED8